MTETTTISISKIEQKQDKIERNFPDFSRAVAAQFSAMSRGELFVADVTGQDVWEKYLSSFPQGSNPIFRKRTEHDCSCCKHFVRSVGNVVAIDGDRLISVWDSEGLDHPYDVVAESMAEYVKSAAIKSVFRTRESQYGAAHTFENRDGVPFKWHHFVAIIDDRHRAGNAQEVRGRLSSSADVLRRGLAELSPDALETVADLIDSGSLYRGEEHKEAVTAFRKLHRLYRSSTKKDLFVWSNMGSRFARFRNTVIGTLAQDLSDGVDVERAVRSFETKVAPQNYQRPTAIITPKMIDAAMATLSDIGLEPAVNRRFAKISDVSVNNVLWVNGSAQTKMRDGLAGLLMEEVKHTPANIDSAIDITAGHFVESVLPGAKDVKLLVKNSHLENFVSLTAPVDEKVGNLFSWDNNFAWSYDGDVTDSIKKRVKAAGGNIDADLRVSLSWFNYDDLDIHCIDPDGRHISYADKFGVLDVDMNAGGGHTREAVENLAWNSPKDGLYHISIHQYSRRESSDVGFVLEIECKGLLRQFSYEKSVRDNERVKALSILVEDGEVASLNVSADLAEGSAGTEKWGIKTESLVPVATILNSPNFWDGQEKGNRHLFFILEGCKNPDETRGIYNEFLSPALKRHRKVFEVLGAKTKCPRSDDQLSGLGFSSARGDSVAVVVSNGAQSRAYNITF